VRERERNGKKRERVKDVHCDELEEPWKQPIHWAAFLVVGATTTLPRHSPNIPLVDVYLIHNLYIYTLICTHTHTHNTQRERIGERFF
jgi:hypothetical protein